MYVMSPRTTDSLITPQRLLQRDSEKKKKKKKEAGESIIEWTMIEETVDVKTGSPH